MLNKIDISVIILSYNSDLDKLIRTIKSVLFQEGCSYEIIISDDGSKNDWFEEIKKLFINEHFEEYKMVKSEKNVGTVLNLWNGLRNCKGKYTKLISAGDYLYDATVLSEWFEFLQSSQIDISFGNAVYYQYTNDVFHPFRAICQPRRIELYDINAYREKDAQLNYLCLSDAVVGANFIIRTEMLCKYIQLIINRVVYAEDNIFRIAVFDGIKLIHFNRNVIYYEHGTGISTSINKTWLDLLDKDLNETFKIICESSKNLTVRKKKLQILFSHKYNTRAYVVLKYMLFPNLIFWKLRKSWNVHYTDTSIDEQFVARIHKNNDQRDEVTS